MSYSGIQPTFGTFPSDLFTANGSNTIFTMSSVPGNDAALLVTIDGVRQHTDTYSYSANTLTFSEAPPSGAVIETVNMGSRADVIITDGVYRKTQFTATAAQTNFDISTGYTVGFVDVYLNGIRLVVDDDFTANDGSTIILAVAAAAGDAVEVVAYGTFNVANALQKSGDTMSGNLVVSGTTTLMSPVAIANTTGNTVVIANTGVVTFNANTAHVGAATFSNNITVAGTATFNGSVVTSGAVQFNGATLNTNSNWGSFINPKSGGGVGDFTVTRPDGAVSWFSIDGAGRVTMPYQPLFIGAHNNQYATSFTSNSVIPVSVVYYNIGSCYNSSTYRFTCPVAGYYEVKMQDITQGSVASSIGFTVNGSLAFKAYTEDRDKHCFATWYCSAGDYVEFRVLEGPTTLYGSSGYAHYSIRLVG